MKTDEVFTGIYLIGWFVFLGGCLYSEFGWWTILITPLLFFFTGFLLMGAIVIPALIKESKRTP